MMIKQNMHFNIILNAGHSVLDRDSQPINGAVSAPAVM